MNDKLVRVQKPISGEVVKLLPYRKARGNNIIDPENRKYVNRTATVLEFDPKNKDGAGCLLVTVKVSSLYIGNGTEIHWRLSSLARKRRRRKELKK